MTGETEAAPQPLSRKERREREAAAERGKNSRAAKRAKREAEDAAPPADLPPLPARARRAERDEPQNAPKKRFRRAVEAPVTPDAPAPRGSWKLPVIIVCVIFLLLLALVVTGALLVHRVDTIYPGVTLAGTDLSGMTRNEARDELLALGH